MNSSLVKFMRSGGERKQEAAALHWGRAGADGLPFRGASTPLLRDDEFESRVVRVADARNGKFFTGDPEQNTCYLSVLDRAANGWYQVLFVERHRDEKTNHYHVYVEWLEYYLEDGEPAKLTQAR